VSFFLAVGLSGCQRETTADTPAAAAEASREQNLGPRTNPRDGAEMVLIPPGEFLMGSDPEEIDRIWKQFNWNGDEKQFTKGEQPAHRVRVDGFWMYRHDVTVAQYRKFCDATGRPMPAPPAWGWTDTHPVVNVSWEDARAYCSWAGGRLPYEAEWEYAARGGQTGLGGRPRTVFVWGDALPRDRVANLADASFKQSRYYNPGFHLFDGYDDGHTYTSPVGVFPPNGFGLHDMAGNVLQWCEDWFGEGYYRDSPRENPRGPSSGQRRVLRGGAYDTTPTITRISRRLSNRPDIRHDEKGFRCVQEP
jgi:formylglycine-generating enzyme required for sulfatase activity